MTPENDSLSEELRFWIAQTVEGDIREVRRQARWRPQYFVDVHSPLTETAVLKMARAPRHVIERSALLSTFNTTREAVVLRSLRESEVRVPPFLGFHEESGSLLMAKVEGSAQVHAVEDPVQLHALAVDFADQLASLHRLDVTAVVRNGDLRIPSNAEELALDNFLRYAETDLDTVLRKRPDYADPLLALARAWAHNRFPEMERAPTLVQGDCGPDQFLFDGRRVTAIIDWELAHIGDPMVDLGAMRLRECLYPAGMFPVVLRRYRELAMPVDDQAIRYYTVVTILFTLFGTIGGTVRLDPRNDEVIQQLWWQVALRRALCEAIAEWEGIELILADDLQSGASSASSASSASRDADIEVLVADRIHQLAQRGGQWSTELRSTLALADALVNARRGADARKAANRADLSACLSAPVGKVDEGLRTLEDRIEAEPWASFEQRLQILYNMAVREQLAWLPLVRADRWVEDNAQSVGDLRADHEALGLQRL